MLHLALLDTKRLLHSTTGVEEYSTLFVEDKKITPGKGYSSCLKRNSGISRLEAEANFARPNRKPPITTFSKKQLHKIGHSSEDRHLSMHVDDSSITCSVCLQHTFDGGVFVVALINFKTIV